MGQSRRVTQRLRILLPGRRKRVWTSADGQRGVWTHNRLRIDIAVAVDVTAVTNRRFLNLYEKDDVAGARSSVRSRTLRQRRPTAETVWVGSTGMDVLGAHNNGGRGCAGCHAPHSGAAGGGGNAATNAAAFNDPTLRQQRAVRTRRNSSLWRIAARSAADMLRPCRPRRPPIPPTKKSCAES